VRTRVSSASRNASPYVAVTIGKAVFEPLQERRPDEAEATRQERIRSDPLAGLVDKKPTISVVYVAPHSG
jgi:hypothetical protein